MADCRWPLLGQTCSISWFARQVSRRDKQCRILKRRQSPRKLSFQTLPDFVPSSIASNTSWLIWFSFLYEKTNLYVGNLAGLCYKAKTWDCHWCRGMNLANFRTLHLHLVKNCAVPRLVSPSNLLLNSPFTPETPIAIARAFTHARTHQADARDACLNRVTYLVGCETVAWRIIRCRLRGDISIRLSFATIRVIDRHNTPVNTNFFNTRILISLIPCCERFHLPQEGISQSQLSWSSSIYSLVLRFNRCRAACSNFLTPRRDLAL